MDEYDSEIYKNRKISIVYDNDYAMNPVKEWDTLGTFSCFHNRYDLSSPGAIKDMDELKELIERPDVLSLPLYLYDHSGITISTDPFSCPWDSGQVGYIHITHEKIKEEYGNPNPKALKKVKKLLQGEVETFDAYLTGQVYGYQVDGEPEPGEDRETAEENLDSCYGYYGDDGAKAAIEDGKATIDWDIKQAEIKHFAIIDAARKAPILKAIARLDRIHRRI